MGRRKNKQGPAEAVAGLIGIGFLYLLITHQLAHMLKLIAIVGGLGLLVAIGFLALRGRRQLPTKSGPSQARRQKPIVVPVAAGPDVLDRARMGANAASVDYQAVAAQSTARPSSWSLGLLRELEWKRFEEICEGFWKAKGYRAELTGRGADGGIDIKLYRPSAPDKLLAIIQCKSRSQDSVGVATVRELFGVMHHVGAPMGILVTSTGFHPAAIEFAAGKRLQLVDGPTLYKQILELPPLDAEQLLAHVTRGDYVTPTCPSCDVKMVRRTNRTDGGEFYGCSNFPQCRQTLAVRR